MMLAKGEILIILDCLNVVPDVCFNDAKIFFWIRLDNFSVIPDVSADGYDVGMLLLSYLASLDNKPRTCL